MARSVLIPTYLWYLHRGSSSFFHFHFQFQIAGALTQQQQYIACASIISQDEVPNSIPNHDRRCSSCCGRRWITWHWVSGKFGKFIWCTINNKMCHVTCYLLLQCNWVGVQLYILPEIMPISYYMLTLLWIYQNIQIPQNHNCRFTYAKYEIN